MITIVKQIWLVAYFIMSLDSGVQAKSGYGFDLSERILSDSFPEPSYTHDANQFFLWLL